MTIKAHKKEYKEYYVKRLAKPNRFGNIEVAKCRNVVVWGFSIDGGEVVWGYDRKRDALTKAVEQKEAK